MPNHQILKKEKNSHNLIKMSIKSLIPKRHAVEDSDDDDDSMSSMSEFVASSGTGSGRKRKLDHLTWEEKVQRK